MEDRIQSCAMESGLSALAASRHCKRAFLPKQVSRKVLKERLMRLVGVIAEELETDIEGVGSTPFRREDLARGFEPDACYYLLSC
jgi:hypothetical protein